MKRYRADLHVHTVLSPCGDLEMSPINIINEAKKRGIEIIGITDHNSTRHCEVATEIGKEQGIFVLCGAEVNTKEEIHVLTFFEDFEKLNDFQKYLNENLVKIKNDVDKFGHQLVVDRDEVILSNEENLLIASLDQSVYEVERKVHELNGLFIPAHVDRSRNSILSQLGFIPDDLNIDGIEISKQLSKNDFLNHNSSLKKYAMIQSSDAHYIHNLANVETTFEIDEPSFCEISKALKSVDNRKILLP